MRWLLLALIGLLVGCGGRPLISPALQKSATRAALRASMHAEETAAPQDASDVLAIGVTGDPRVRLPVRDASVDDDLAADAVTGAGAKEERAPDSTRSAQERTDAATTAAALRRSSDPALSRALEQLTTELREQRMLTLMQLVGGERPAPEAAAGAQTGPAQPTASLERAMGRLEASQEAQAEDAASLKEALDALRALVEERMPGDVTSRLDEVRERVRDLSPEMERIRRDQEALRARLERLEATPAAPAPPAAPAAQSFSLDELRKAVEDSRAAERTARGEQEEPAPGVGAAPEARVAPASDATRAPEVDDAAPAPTPPAPDDVRSPRDAQSDDEGGGTEPTPLADPDTEEGDVESP